MKRICKEGRYRKRETQGTITLKMEAAVFFENVKTFT